VSSLGAGSFVGQRSLRLRVAPGLEAAVALLGACLDQPPSPPSPAQGTVEHRAIPSTVLSLPLTDQAGQTITLGFLWGRTVMPVSFLSLWSDICPLTTGDLLQIQRSLDAARVRHRVQIVELSVDPGRDRQTRLAAYGRLTSATWEHVTESLSALAAVSNYFGFVHEQVPQGTAFAIDWLTHRPLTYDVNHPDGYVLIDKNSSEIFSAGAEPDFHGSLNPTLRHILSDQGVQNLEAPPNQVGLQRQPLSWAIRQTLPAAGA